ncbi:transposase domain-containing protein [Streptomyces albidoflavus]
MVRYGGQRLCPCFSGGRTLLRSASRGWDGCRRVAGLGLLTWVYRFGLMHRVVAACGRAEHRRRLLPARLVVYFVLALALVSSAPYLEMMRHLVEGLRGQGLLGQWRIPAKSSLLRARQRLGSEPLRVLVAATAKPMGTETTAGCFWRGLRLPTVDSTCWDVADSPANEAAFGRPGNSRGHDKSRPSPACTTSPSPHDPSSPAARFRLLDHDLVQHPLASRFHEVGCPRLDQISGECS